ncbi:MAG: nitrogenase iron protein NifH [Eubacteriales bacterium]
MIKIAIYGKGGIGKSTTASNLSAALSKKYKVMQIGCDPKADSSKNLLGDKKCTPVLDCMNEKGEDTQLSDIVCEGYGGVVCVEAGGPTPGIGCAGLGIIETFNKLEELDAYEIYKPDIVIYDVLGDVVCGGFAMPLRNGYADHVFIVTSGEMMALFAASNIAKAVENFKNRSYAKNSGIILNERLVENEEEVVSKVAKEMKTDIISKVRRSAWIQKAEDKGQTVIEAYPESDIAMDYLELANKIAIICGL